MRIGKEFRKTKETEIQLEVNLDGTGKTDIDTGIGFFDHLLDAFARNALIDLKLEAKGDLKTGTHHTIEDVGIVLGLAVAKALKEKKGINRYGFFKLQMDDSVVDSTVDLSGRPYLIFNGNFDKKEIRGKETKNFPTEEIEEFFRALANSMKANIYLSVLCGKNDHHKIEAIFKSFGRALKMAVELDSRIKNNIPSTKEVL